MGRRGCPEQVRQGAFGGRTRRQTLREIAIRVSPDGPARAKAGIQEPRPEQLPRFRARACTRIAADTGFRECFCPLSARFAGGEGGARRGSAGRVRWVAPLFGTRASPHLTPTLSAPEGGEGDIPATCPALRSVH